ncbi:MAG TPA: heparinase II/III family protein, partial [Gemmatimonadaceae bacterium]
MNVLLDDASFALRVGIANGPLRPLADSLAADLEPLLHREIYFPREKALLSRSGGRCADDGELLTFDPFSPREHRCPRCGKTYTGELHDRFWIYWYQLWLAERGIHAASLSAVRGDERYAGLARTILGGYAERYLNYPNVDNVLGPTRLFFSTYLESIWLVQICIAADILSTRDPKLAETVRDRIVEPSRALIAEYDEGASNRQVWNDAALLAAARLLGDDRRAEQAVHGSSGLVYHLRNGLLVDGSWYEGENYHLFAHRGLWYGVAMAERAEIPLDAADVDRFQLGFSTPFLTALPDLTLPSRRDSQYAISLRQWRIAEHCEVGLARRDDPSLLAALARLYTTDIPQRDTGRATSSADVERNAPPTALTRADLSWRALLFALADLPELAGAEPASALLEGQGIAVARRNAARVYVALDYGHSGGGHGHPDRLNLLLVDGETRWLDDYGTGSYTDRTLHWYRSTLAHNAPLVDGRSQRPTDGLLLAYEERGDLGWIKAKAEIAPGVEAIRTIVVTPGYLIDTLEWASLRDVVVDLPLHADLGVLRGAIAVEKPLTGGDGTEDGFDFVHDSYVHLAAAGECVPARARQGDQWLAVWAECSTTCEWWRTVAPGPPGRDERAFRVLRARAPRGKHRIAWDWSGRIRDVSFGDEVRVSLNDGTEHGHLDALDHWQVSARRGDEHRVVELRGMQRPRTPQTGLVEPARSPEPGFRILYHAPEMTRDLARDAYRRSESAWEEAGFPRATVGLHYGADGLGLNIRVPGGERTFVPPDAVNRYDNEPPDINGDSVQLYLRFGDELCGWMLVPETDPTVRVRPIDGWRCSRLVTAHWEPTSGGGYALFV